MRVKGQVKNVIKVEKKVFQGKNSTIPMKHFPIDKDSAGRGMWKILERPAKSVVVEERVEDGTDYLNSVDRIAEPPGFVKIRGTSGKGKTEMLQRYPGRAVYQPTKIVKEGGAVERELDDWMVRTWDWQERKTKQLKQPKPSSAPTTNLKSSQRVERNRLSTPSRFERLGAKFTKKSDEDMRKMFPNKKIYRLMKALPGEEVGGKKVDIDSLAYAEKDPAIFEWVVEREPSRKAIKYNPSGEIKIKPSRLYTRQVLEPGPSDLPSHERATYVDEKMCLLAVPKAKWYEKHVKVYARNDDDMLIEVVKTRVDRTKEEVEAEIRQELESKAVKERSRFALENVDRLKSFEEGWSKQRLQTGLKKLGTTVQDREKKKTTIQPVRKTSKVEHKVRPGQARGKERRTAMTKVYKREKSYIGGKETDTKDNGAKDSKPKVNFDGGTRKVSKPPAQKPGGGRSFVSKVSLVSEGEEDEEPDSDLDDIVRIIRKSRAGGK